MRRRIIIILSALFLLAVTVILYITAKNGIKTIRDPYVAITGEAVFIIETIDVLSFFNSITTGKGIFGEMNNVGELAGFTGKLKSITDNINKVEIRDMISERHAIISLHPDHTGRLKVLLSIAVAPDVKIRHVKQALASTGITNITETSLRKNTVIRAPYSGQNDSISFSVKSGLLLASNSFELLEESFASMESGTDIRTSKGFSRILSASGHDKDKIFVVFKNLPEILKPAFLADRERSVAGFARLASAVGGGLYITDDGISFSGFTECDTTTDILYKQKFIEPAVFEGYRILPAGTAMFESFILDPSVDQNDKRDSFAIQHAPLRNFLGDEVIRAYIDILGSDIMRNKLIIYELSNPEQAYQLFGSNAESNYSISWYQPDDQINIPVYHVPVGLANTLYPGLADGIADSLVAFYDKYMITGGSLNTVTKVLYDNLLNNTLANDLVYRDFESTLPSRASYYLYFVPSKITSYLENYLDEDIVRSFRENRPSLNKIQAAGYQLSSSNNMIYNSLSVRFKDEVRKESLSEWETLLDTTVAIKPFFFTNHTTGAREIFVQDLKNNIYLINAAGRILWKAPLSERIAGTVYMIDFYRNGKFQLLFNGRNYLHLIDRNGNYVERYPVKLRSPASNPIALFDYDNNRNYRIVVACEDRLIYAYDRAGNVVKGWKPFRTSGTVKTQANYFRVSGKDYIAVSDETSLYLLDRYGNRRVSFKEPATRAQGSALKLNSGSDPFLVCSSSDGIIQNIYFDGTVKKFNVGNFGPDHKMDIFDIDGDGFGEYIFVDLGKLYLYDHNRTELFSRSLGSEMLSGPMTFIFNTDDKKIGIFDAGENQIWLLDKQGVVMDGFPLRGASMFSIGKLSDKNSWNLIVGGPDRFLYNYLIGDGT